MTPPAADFTFFTRRRFFPLFCTQFLGALNDNLLKTALLVLVSYAGLSVAGWDAPQLINAAAGLFILPFFLFSASAGRIAEKFDKALIARWVKLSELGIMLLAGWGFFSHHAGFLLLALFLMGTHSTFFGPVKYAILPQTLRPNELVSGNGLIEMGTFIAVLVGQLSGSLLMMQGEAVVVGVLVVVAGLGVVSSFAMPPTPPTAPDLMLSANLLADTRAVWREARRQPTVWAAIIGISWFWLLGSVFLTQMPTFTRLHLGGDVQVYALVLTVFSLSIGVGSVLCARWSAGVLRLSLALWGLLGMALAGAALSVLVFPLWQGALRAPLAFIADPTACIALALFALLGLAGGVFTVPLYTWLQLASPVDFLAQAVAANNIVNGLFMVAATGGSALVLMLSPHISLLFLLTSLGNVPMYFWLRRQTRTVAK